MRSIHSHHIKIIFHIIFDKLTSSKLLSRIHKPLSGRHGLELHFDKIQAESGAHGHLKL